MNSFFLCYYLSQLFAGYAILRLKLSSPVLEEYNLNFTVRWVIISHVFTSVTPLHFEATRGKQNFKNQISEAEYTRTMVVCLPRSCFFRFFSVLISMIWLERLFKGRLSFGSMLYRNQQFAHPHGTCSGWLHQMATMFLHLSAIRPSHSGDFERTEAHITSGAVDSPGFNKHN